MDRIAIIGISGSGKSTFADKLGKILNRPVVHLDKEFWTTNWTKRYSAEDWIKFHTNLINHDKWIIDGNYRNTQKKRLERADTIIFFDFPKWRCLWRAFVRIFNRHQPIDKAEGVKNKMSWELITYIINYPLDEIRSFVEQYKNGRKIYIVKSNIEIAQLLTKFSEGLK
jgi:adenylate kinase family enzyme